MSAKIAHAIEEVGRDATPQTYAAAIRAVLEDNRVELERILAGAGMAAVLAGMRSILEFRGEAQTASAAVASASEASARPAQRQAKVEVPAEVAGQKLAPAVTEAASALTTKGAVPLDWLGNLIAGQKAKGKKVAQAAIEEATRVIRDQLAETIQSGTQKGFARKVREALADSSFLSENTLECAFRTGAMLSYGQGQLQLIQGNDFARDFFPYAAYDATHDDRTRANHLSMEKRGLDGTNFYRIDDPVFLKFMPPWGYNCRCTFSPATVEMAASAGVKEAVEWLRTGNPPSSPARVAHPPFEPDAGFVREMATGDWRAEYVLGDMATRAPRGGVSIGGTTYKGGQFIPNAVVAQATEAERQALEQAREEPQQRKSTDSKKPAATPTNPKGRGRKPGGGSRKKVGFRTVPTESLAVDPQRFQYKVNLFGPGGTGEEMSDVQRFRPEFGGLVLVWHDPADGKDYVVNGHHRYALAKRTGHPKIAIHYIEAATAEEARAVGALANIAEGHGTAIDAAKFMRDTGATLDDFRREGVSLKARLSQEAVVLAGLSDALFAKVAMEELSVPRALAIGRHLKSPKDQNALFDRVRQADARTKKRIPAEAVEEMAKEMAITSRAGGQADLFGQTQDRDLFAERGALKAFVRQALSQEANAFKAVSTDRKAETLGRTGNVIKAAENRKVAEEAGRQRGEFDALANYRGPISDAINRAAERLADDPFHSDQIRRELLDEIRGLLAKGA